MNTNQQNTMSENQSNLLISKTLIWVTLICIAMAMLESSVVIYLRELYYPTGFQFPLKPASYTIAVTEIFRELATIIMLSGIGMLVGKNKQERFAWFIYSFAIWDIFYYVFLYLIINWPLSLSDWDVLFLIPIMWVGPVWAPVLLSVLMILLAQCILYFSGHRQISELKLHEWIVLITGALIVIIAFCKDFYLYMTSHFPTIPGTQLFFSKRTFEYAAQYIPVRFDVMLFLFGCAVICAGIGIYAIRNMKEE
ncbi:MAG: hypothetical protein NTY07_13320 [Bacteroidia bacterium]|nr:hypothetical protein [Bacteroidia bacterium]